MQIRNKTIADRVGHSESGISLIRSGQRFPRMDTMERIEKAYGWTVPDQVAARSDYPAALERMLREFYRKNPESLHA